MNIDLRADVRPRMRRDEEPSFFAAQFQAAIQGLVLPWRQPLLAILTFVMIIILLAMTAGFLMVQKSLPSVNQQWNAGERVVLFLKTNITDKQAQDFLQQLQQRPDIAKAVYISPDQGLQQLTERSNFNSVAAKLPNNPLPGVIELLPALSTLSFSEATQLVEELKASSMVEHSQYNLDKIKNQYDKIALGQQLINDGVVLLILIVVALLVNYLLHSWHGSIPSLFYGGIFYSVLGGLLAWLLVDSFFAQLAMALQQLFGGQLVTLTNKTFSNLLLVCGGLGFISAVIAAVFILIHSLEPRQPSKE